MSKVLQFVGTAWGVGDGAGSKLRLLWRQTANLRAQLRLKEYDPEQTFAIRTRYGVLHFRDNFGDVTNVHDLLWKQIYRTGIPLGPGCIFDVGANVGYAAAFFAHEHPDRAIHCFEPLPENVAMVRRNCPAAHIVAAAVGAAAGTVTLRADAQHVMATSIETAWETQPIELPVITLDEYAVEHEIADVALLKIDTEGMELDVLHGARRLLDRTGQIVIETHGRERHDATLEFLRDTGSRIHQSHFNGRTGIVAAVRDEAGVR